MATFHYKIIYTSDVHGQLLADQVATKKKELCGLSRLKSYLNSIKDPYLLLDNGDFLQGHIMLDYHRLYESSRINPVSEVMNHLGYDYITLGNHDFNFGMSYLNQTLSEMDSKVVCANVYDNHDAHLFQPYVIKEIHENLNIGIIGAVTHYIPNWEKPEQIHGIYFKDAYETIKHYVNLIRKDVDFVLVLYHGGFEKDLKTHMPIGRQTDENQGYLISQIEGIDLLLTGHQHVPMCYEVNPGPLVMQTGLNAFDFGEIDLKFKQNDDGKWIRDEINGNIKKMDFEEDPYVIKLLSDITQQTEVFLDEVIGTTKHDMRINDPLSLRSKKHPLMQLMNDLQLSLSGADVSAASLPNQPIGFGQTITLRDLAANFVYPNTFVKLEITGAMLKKAIERSAEYYHIDNHLLTIDESFLFPKVEHYNVDIFDGVDYVIDPRQPKGNRLIKIDYHGNPFLDDQILTIILNNYRAIGGGDYSMYKDAKIIASYDITLFDLFKDYVLKHQVIDVKIKNNFKIIY